MSYNGRYNSYKNSKSYNRTPESHAHTQGTVPSRTQLPRSTRTTSYGGPLNTLTGYSLYVGGLPLDFKEEDLMDLFKKKYPSSINKVKIVFDMLTSVSKGYGFVEFNSNKDQMSALKQMNGMILRGNPIKIRNASGSGRTTTNRLNRGDKKSGRNNLLTRSMSKDYSFLLSNYEKTRVVIKNKQKITENTDPNNTTLHIAGLYSKCTESELKQYFEPFGNIVYAKIQKHKKPSKTFTTTNSGHIQFDDRYSAECAIANLHHALIGTSKIKLSWGKAGTPPSSLSSIKITSTINLKRYKAQPELPTIYSNPCTLGINDIIGKYDSHDFDNDNMQYSEKLKKITGKYNYRPKPKDETNIKASQAPGTGMWSSNTHLSAPSIIKSKQIENLMKSTNTNVNDFYMNGFRRRNFKTSSSLFATCEMNTDSSDGVLFRF